MLAEIRCFKKQTVSLMSAALLTLSLFAGSTARVVAAPVLLAGDRAASVTINDRPLSGNSEKVDAFKRGDVLYVSLDDVMRAFNGSMVHDGTHYTVKSFRYSANSKTFTFTMGSAEASVEGKPIELKAPAVKAYGRAFIPLSFFGSGAVRTHVTMSSDGTNADISTRPAK
jgi:hypothetical protein